MNIPKKVRASAMNATIVIVIWLKKSANAKTYDEALNTLKEFVKEFVKCLGLLIEPYVVICPAVGSPGNIWRFTGHPTDFEATALYHLGKLCIEKPCTRLVLDLTHGVNFMPAVTLKLAEKLASIILAAHMGSVASLEDGVELHVYNSDPASPGSTANKLNINRIMKDKIKTITAPHDLPKRLIRNRTKVPCGLIPGLFRLSSLPFGDSCDVFGSHLRFPISFRLKAYCHASTPLP
jgi:CRISPR-associated protein Csx1